MSNTRVVICDDHEIIREAVAVRLNRIDGVSVVGEAGDGSELLDLVSSLRPHLVFLDLEMPRQNGLRTTMELRECFPEVGVVILSAHAEPEVVETVMGLGASAFLSKAATNGEMTDAIDAVLSGRSYVGEKASPDSDRVEQMKRICDLTSREREILGLLSTGMRAKGIANELGVETATVYTHVRNAVGKLGVDTRLQAVAVVQHYSYLARPDAPV